MTALLVGEAREVSLCWPPWQQQPAPDQGKAGGMGPWSVVVSSLVMEKAYGIQEKKSKTDILGPLVNEF